MGIHRSLKPNCYVVNVLLVELLYMAIIKVYILRGVFGNMRATVHMYHIIVCKVFGRKGSLLHQQFI